MDRSYTIVTKRTFSEGTETTRTAVSIGRHIAFITTPHTSRTHHTASLSSFYSEPFIIHCPSYDPSRKRWTKSTHMHRSNKREASTGRTNKSRMEFHLFCACSSDRFAFSKIRFHLWLCVSATVWLSVCGYTLVRAGSAGGNAVGSDRRIRHRYASTERSVLVLLGQIRCQPFGKGFRFLLDATTTARSERGKARGSYSITTRSVPCSREIRADGRIRASMLATPCGQHAPPQVANKLWSENQRSAVVFVSWSDGSFCMSTGINSVVRFFTKARIFCSLHYDNTFTSRQSQHRTTQHHSRDKL